MFFVSLYVFGVAESEFWGQFHSSTSGFGHNLIFAIFLKTANRMALKPYYRSELFLCGCVINEINH